MLSENSIRIPSMRGADKIQDLGCHLLRKDCYRVVELSFTDSNTADRELCVRLPNQILAASGQKTGNFINTFATGEGEEGAEGGNIL